MHRPSESKAAETPPAPRARRRGSRSPSHAATPDSELTSCALEAVEVRWSPRARRWRLEVPWGEAPRLTVPQGTSRAGVQRLLEEKRLWIEDQRRRQVPRLCLDPSAVSESQARLTAREFVSTLAREEAKRIGVDTSESVSEANARSGAPALRAARSPSTGGSCSRRLRCSTTWSCMSSVTCASRTTRDGSGRSSSDIARTGASSVLGCVTTDMSSSPSALTSTPPDRQPGAMAVRRPTSINESSGVEVTPSESCLAVRACARARCTAFAAWDSGSGGRDGRDRRSGDGGGSRPAEASRPRLPPAGRRGRGARGGAPDRERWPRSSRYVAASARYAPATPRSAPSRASAPAVAAVSVRRIPRGGSGRRQGAEIAGALAADQPDGHGEDREREEGACGGCDGNGRGEGGALVVCSIRGRPRRQARARWRSVRSSGCSLDEPSVPDLLPAVAAQTVEGDEGGRHAAGVPLSSAENLQAVDPLDVLDGGFAGATAPRPDAQDDELAVDGRVGEEVRARVDMAGSIPRYLSTAGVATRGRIPGSSSWAGAASKNGQRRQRCHPQR